MPDSPSRHDAPSQTPRKRVSSGQVIAAQSWPSLLEAVAQGDVHVLLSTPGGARVALVAEEDLVALQEAAHRADTGQVALTGRERQALLAIERGLSTAQVAEELGVAVSTAVQHLAAARRKYGVRTSTAAAARAREGRALD